MSAFSFDHLPWSTKAMAGMCQAITRGHYLHKMPDPRTSYEVYQVSYRGAEIGGLVFGRPEATRCADWYGSVDDAAAGRCEVTRWQVLNLARVWLVSDYQAGGCFYGPKHVPGFVDRRGLFRSTLASDMLRAALAGIGCEYLCRRPPCFLDEPYEIRWVLSYCDTHLHRGTIYRAAGFELYRTNARGIQTWRVRLPALTPTEHWDVRQASATNPRSIAYRARRAQGVMAL